MDYLQKQDQAFKRINNTIVVKKIKKLYLTFFLLVIWLISFSFLYYNLFFIEKMKNITAMINVIKENEVILEWWNWYWWINKQILILKNYKEEQKIIIENKKDKLYQKVSSSIPDELSYESTALFFEDLFLTISAKNNPVILDSITLWNEIIKTTKWNEKDISYKKYPITLSFQASDKKFKQILDIIQVSGSFEEKYYFKNKPLPIMSVSNVNIDFVWNKEVNDKWLKSRSMQIFMYTYTEDEKKKNKN